ncbi:phosphoenolpyruvate carboxykinase [Thecamonas trahens ATCC 50062]|uniref:phosphoenolpyruvate carboxykinase (GTP) n=1 Tax=Thecamonas trahens ATCC 50062 TaxID=461836 RepID=A0A0L0DAX2_THETB|nr:phosphoenolpyruvate carboxykinase [Thecamonas trahens ATCC 50062]KNC49385.1 phosphoenolpyruvate carboxykinase [Thecamonas trahens ATCC 50062]|eukprot:XP_013757810.1 phosphoenolpyruvate carboxykinase [Thecamonas trahens ATCC 50062]
MLWLTLTSLNITPSLVGRALGSVRSASAVSGAIQSALGHHKALAEYVEHYAGLCNPDALHVCDGSEGEYTTFMETMVEDGSMFKLNEAKRPNSYLARSDPRDVARSEESTFISCVNEEDAGPTNNWRDPVEMKATMANLYKDCMVGRTMFVVPFSMGPIGGPISHIGVQLTDSMHVAASMRLMTRMGKAPLEALGTDGEFVKCMHSVGYPLADGKADVAWPCDPDNKYITHYPEENLAESYGSGYGGNSLLGKKAFALRLASAMGKREGWLAEHMLILGVTNPEGKKKYVAAAFPSACGKTNFAMLEPTMPGWKVECVGDDIAWMKFGPDGKLYAINPENGFFGVAPGTSMGTNPNAMRSLDRDCIYTNVAMTADGDVWWEGMTEETPEGMTNWLGEPHNPASNTPAAHPNSRFTVPIANCPVLDPNFEALEGVPIDAIMFGGRRPTTIPLVHEAFSWNHGVLMGASVASEKTAAATGDDIGEIRHDPFAMLPFCGYNMGDYFQHWIDMGKTEGAKLPSMYLVNWFRQDPETGKFIWPGFGENSRVLKWIFERTDGVTDNAAKTPIGYVPTPDALDTDGLAGITNDELTELLRVDPDAWQREINQSDEYLTSTFGPKLPAELKNEIESLKKSF